MIIANQVEGARGKDWETRDENRIEGKKEERVIYTCTCMIGKSISTCNFNYCFLFLQFVARFFDIFFGLL